MSDCIMLQYALERCLPEDKQLQFETHLNTCEACRAAVAEWEQNRGLIDRYVDERTFAPDDAAVNRLLADVDASQSKSNNSIFIWAVPVVAVAAVLVISLLFVFSSTQNAPPIPTAKTPTIAYELVFPEKKKNRYSVFPGDALLGENTGKVLRFNNTTLGMNETTNLQVSSISSSHSRFSLSSGIVAAKLEHVPNREQLQIVARGVTVVVKGTTFWVDASKSPSVEVGVVEGTVWAHTENDKKWVLHAGHKVIIDSNADAPVQPISTKERQRIQILLHPEQRLIEENDKEDDAIAKEIRSDESPSTNQEEPSKIVDSPGGSRRNRVALAAIEELLLNRKYSQAEIALKNRLRSFPQEVKSLELLATCYRKQQKYKLAAQVYEQLTALGSATARNRARFRLSGIYQDYLGQDTKAVEVLRAYLASPPATRSNTPEARLRHAVSLHRLGRTAEYRTTLQIVISAHPGTREAQKARQLLNQ